MINPEPYPAAVIAGNVETSQVIVDTLFGALGVARRLAGHDEQLHRGATTSYQYYETICGGCRRRPRTSDG